MTEHEQKLIFEDYLKQRGYKGERIPELPNHRTPDYKISGEHLASGVCELKSPMLVMDSESETYKFKTTNSKLLTFIHTAVTQLNSFDPAHTQPRIVTFTSSNFQLHWKTLTDALQGGVVVAGALSPDFRQTRVAKDSAKDIPQIDLYLWLQINAEAKVAYQATLVVNEDSPHASTVKSLVKDLAAAPVSRMDNILTLNSNGIARFAA